MKLAEPLTATIKIIVESIEGLRSLAVLMGSAPARKAATVLSARE